MSKSEDAIQCALRLLGYRPRSVNEITLRLKEKDFSEEAIHEAVTRLQDWGYLNDVRFTEDWIRNRFANKSMGPIRLQLELRQKGIHPDLINEKVQEAFSAVSEFDLALNLANTKFKDATDWRKVAGLLKRRGFSYDVIASVKESLL